jgi:2-(3-amino-3-carboxypropyl)histidine synthase
LRTIFIEARFDGEISLGKEAIDHIKKNRIKSVGLFASVQFLRIDDISRQLKELNVKVFTTKARRTSEPVQILGCDAYHDSFEKDIFADADVLLYIGDGMFHPKALLLAQRDSEKKIDCIIWDPVANEMKLLTQKDVEHQLKRSKANILKYLTAQKIGILITTKPGQEYIKGAIALKNKLKKEGKDAYLFIDDTIGLDKLENYPFIQCWVNTACPRIGTDDITSINKPMINLREAMNPERALENLKI